MLRTVERRISLRDHAALVIVGDEIARVGAHPDVILELVDDRCHAAGIVQDAVEVAGACPLQTAAHAAVSTRSVVDAGGG